VSGRAHRLHSLCLELSALARSHKPRARGSRAYTRGHSRLARRRCRRSKKGRSRRKKEGVVDVRKKEGVGLDELASSVAHALDKTAVRAELLGDLGLHARLGIAIEDPRVDSVADVRLLLRVRVILGSARFKDCKSLCGEEEALVALLVIIPQPAHCAQTIFSFSFRSCLNQLNTDQSIQLVVLNCKSATRMV
jgi:hypothetical protein